MSTLSEARVSGAARLRRNSVSGSGIVDRVAQSLAKLAPCITSEIMNDTLLSEKRVKAALRRLRADRQVMVIGRASWLPRWRESRQKGFNGSALVWALPGTPMLERISGTSSHHAAPRARKQPPDPARIAQTITVGRGFNWSAGRLF